MRHPIADQPGKVLRHVVLFAFNETAGPEEIHGIEQAFSALPGQIEAIHDFEWGVDVSVEGLSQGFSHCFLVTFLSEADRDSYLPHPAHQAFVARLQPYLAKALVFDYWSG
ncbi:MAG: Dabb family protein [Anaerolineae bacterium]|nr:Dabb family protein [Anaerolineales bacterium]MCQ3976428.1 Dabb family protein [Anaerolineae bacterium]